MHQQYLCIKNLSLTILSCHFPPYHKHFNLWVLHWGGKTIKQEGKCNKLCKYNTRIQEQHYLFFHILPLKNEIDEGTCTKKSIQFFPYIFSTYYFHIIPHTFYALLLKIRESVGDKEWRGSWKNKIEKWDTAKEETYNWNKTVKFIERQHRTKRLISILR